ncbi:MAG: DUF1552 domain-containing protein [Steroidobacteraceae bacterium]
MFITKKHLSRRTVLRGLGATVALPLLDAMIPASTALAATAAKPTPRLGFIYFPHGAIIDRWSPAAVGKDFELPQILSPLADFRQHLTVVSGLRNKAGESPAPHAIMAGTWLGCVPPAVSNAPKGGVSADQIAVQHLGQDSPLPSLELSGEPGAGPCDPGYGCGFGNTISFRTATQPLPMESNPRKVFYRLFGEGDNAAERQAVMDETGSLLDLIKGSASDLQRKLGAADRAMVTDYLDSVREVERRLQKMQGQSAGNLDLPSAPTGVQEDFGKQLDTMFDLMALAYQANLTRVVTFMMAKEVSMRTYNQIGVPDAFHPLSHHQNDSSKLDRLAKIQTYHTTAFAKFVKKLGGMQDGDGTMLDHSLILFGSNMSNSDLHNNDPLPSVLVGRAYGRVKGGQHLRFAQDTPLANLLVTMLDRSGVPVESLGNSTGQFAEV